MGNPQFEALGPLWGSRIFSLDASKTFIPGSTLVALDIESSIRGVSEIGLAFLHVSGQEPIFPIDCGTRSFYERNNIIAHTVEINVRLSKGASRKRIHFGDTITIEAEEAQPTIIELVSRHISKHGSKLVLVGFDLYRELE